MTDDNLQEMLQPVPPMLDHVVAEAVGKHLARQRRDGDARALALEDVAKVLKVRVPPPHAAVLELERRDVGAAHDLVVRVHLAAQTVRLRVLDLAHEASAPGPPSSLRPPTSNLGGKSLVELSQEKQLKGAVAEVDRDPPVWDPEVLGDESMPSPFLKRDVRNVLGLGNGNVVRGLR